MEHSQLSKLRQHDDFVVFASAKYRFAGRLPEEHPMFNTHILIFDEPPTLHTDLIKIDSCVFISDFEKYDKPLIKTMLIIFLIWCIVWYGSLAVIEFLY